MKRILAIALTMVILATIFAGCESQKITITMVESLTSSERTATLQAVIDRYEAENRNVHIELISPPLEDADAQISQMLANGEADIIEVRDQTVAQYVYDGLLEDLDPYVAQWTHKDTLSRDAWIAMHQLDGKCYLIPSGFYQRCLFYRQDWLEEAGISVPSTWEELLAASRALTDPENNRYGYAFRGGSSGYQYIDTIFWSYIGVDKLADPNAGYFLKDGNGATIFTLPACREALAYYKELFAASPAESITWSFTEMVDSFIKGNTAFLIQDAEVIPRCAAEMDPDVWNTAPFPTGPSGEAVSPNGFGGWGMAADCENKEAAADFLLYLSNPENNAVYAANHAMVPIHTNASEFSDLFSDGYFACYSEMTADPAVYRHAIEPQMYVAFADFKEEVDTMYQKFLKDELSGSELLTWMDKFWTQAYTEEGQLW